MKEYERKARVVLPNEAALAASVKSFLIQQTTPPKKGSKGVAKGAASSISKTILKKTSLVRRTTTHAPHGYRVAADTKGKKKNKADQTASKLFHVKLQGESSGYIISARSEAEARARPPIVGAVFRPRFKTPAGASKLLRDLISKKMRIVNEFGFDFTREANDVLYAWKRGVRVTAPVPDDVLVVL